MAAGQQIAGQRHRCQLKAQRNGEKRNESNVEEWRKWPAWRIRTNGSFEIEISAAK
jgi:hypothetical protein